MKRPTKGEVRAARNAAGLTQAEAAALVGFTARAWQAWELGQNSMRPAILRNFEALTKKKER
jgi:putative transcriptional regulator